MPSTTARRDPITGQWILVAVDGDPIVMRPRVDVSLPAPPTSEEALPYAVVPADPVLDKTAPVDRQRIADGLFMAASSSGRHERIVEGLEPNVALEALGVERADATLRLYRDRMQALADDNRSRQVGVVKTHGAAAGATVDGASSEVFALPWVPDEMRRKLTAFSGHYRRAGSCLLCDMIRFERTEKVRVVGESLRHIAFAPWASPFPYGLVLAPKGHHPNYLVESDKEIGDLAELLTSTLTQLASALEQPAYRYTLVTAPLDAGADSGHFHWYIEVRPVVVVASALDGMTTYNAVPPELAAKRLREAAS